MGAVVQVNIVITGSQGFVGRALVDVLERGGDQVRGVVRRAALPTDIVVEDIANPDVPWVEHLANVDVVIHLAAQVPDSRLMQTQPELYRQTNTQATLAIARAAQQAGVKRFVFISTFYRSYVQGAAGPVAAYSEHAIPAPQDVYGATKWEAEQGLQAMMGGAMEIVIVRPALVYGAGVRANFRALLKLAASGLPLPLGAICSRNSMVYVGNLVDAIRVCAAHPAAAGQTYLVSDGVHFSVPEIIRKLAVQMERPVRLVPVPVWILRLLGKVTGKESAIDRLTEPHVLDDTKIRTELGWTPPFSADEGFAETVRWYQARG